MKKSTVVIVVLLLVVLGLGLGFFSLYSSNVEYREKQTDYNKLKSENASLKKKVEEYENKKEENQNKEIVVSGDGSYDNLEILSVNDLHIKMELKEKFILLISQTGCGHCTAYKPVLNQVLGNYNVKAYEINLTNLSYDDREFLKSLVKFSGTPTTFFYEDGEENLGLRLVGEASKEKILSSLEEAGYVK